MLDSVRRLRARIGSKKIVVPGVRTLVLDADGRLLLERQRAFGTWALPHGCVDFGESALDAAIRETEEEVGIRIERARLFGIYTDPKYSVVYPNGDQVQTRDDRGLAPAARGTGGGEASEAPHMLVGRREALRRIEACLRAGRNVLLEGPVGVGKTHLALAVAAQAGRPVFLDDFSLPGEEIDGKGLDFGLRCVRQMSQPNRCRAGVRLVLLRSSPLYPARAAAISLLLLLAFFPNSAEAQQQTRLVVGRSVARAADSSSATISYYVFNQTARGITDTTLTVDLSSGVQLVRASQTVSQSGQRLSWPVHALPPHSNAILEVVVGLDASIDHLLDSGASATATVDGEAVGWSAAPSRLPALVDDPRLLACAVEANCADPYVIAKAAELRYDSNQIYDFVRDQIAFEIYRGSMRGSRGVLWTKAGNALDKASLLIALLRASGIPARYVHGDLAPADATELASSIFRSPSRVIGCPPPGATRADPLVDTTVAAETASHSWVEFDLGGGFVAADASFPSVPLGTTVASRANASPELADHLRHFTTIRLGAELTGFGLNDERSQIDVIAQRFPTAALFGRPVVLGHAIGNSNVSSFGTIHTYSPYLFLDDRIGGFDHSLFVEGIDYQEFFVGVAGTFLTRLDVHVDHEIPGGESFSETRTVLDRIGFAFREGYATGEVSPPADAALAVSEMDVVTVSILPGTQDPTALAGLDTRMQASRAELASLAPDLDRIAAQGVSSPADATSLARSRDLGREIAILGTEAVLSAFAGASDFAFEQLQRSYMVESYYDTPRVLIASVTDATESPEVRLDIRRNEVRSFALPGQLPLAPFYFEMTRGLMDTELESSISQDVLGARGRSAADVLSAIANSAATLVTLTTASDLSRVDLSDEAEARIADALGRGKVVLAPTMAVLVDGAPSIAWYELNPFTGHMIGVSEDGGHQAFVEYGELVLTSFLPGQAGIVAGFWLGFSQGVLDFTAGFLDALNRGLTFEEAVRSGKAQIARDVLDALIMLLIGNVSSVLAELDLVEQDLVDDLLDAFFCAYPSLQSLVDPASGGFIDPEDGDFDPEGLVRDLYGCAAELLKELGISTPPLPPLPPPFEAFKTWSEVGAILGLATTFVHVNLSVPGDPRAPWLLSEPFDPVQPTSGDLAITGDEFVYAWLEGAAVPSMHRVRIRNSSSAEDTFSFSASSIPGYEIATSIDSVSVSPGGIGEVGICLAPSAGVPAPGEQVGFTVRTVSSSGSALESAETWEVGEVHGIDMSLDPHRVAVLPGETVPLTLRLRSTGNISEQVTLSIGLPQGLSIAGAGDLVSIAPGEVAAVALTASVHEGLAPGTSLRAVVVADLCAGVGHQACTISPPKTREHIIQLQVSSQQTLSLFEAVQSARTSDPMLVEPLGDLLDTVAAWEGEPGNPLLCAQVRDDLQNVLSLLRADTSLLPLSAALAGLDNELATCDASAFFGALPGAATPLADTLADRERFAFDVALSPQSLTLSSEPSAELTLTLSNRGRESNTLSLAAGSLPSDAQLNDLPPSVTLEPGESRSIPLAFSHSLVRGASFPVSVTATPNGAPGLARTATTLARVRPSAADVVAVAVAPNRVDPGDTVDVSASVLNTANVARDAVLRLTVLDPSGAAPPGFEPLERPVSLASSTEIADIELGTIDTAGFAEGLYKSRVEILGADELTPIGRMAEAPFFVGDLVTASVVAEPAVVVPGSPTVSTRVTVDVPAATASPCASPPLIELDTSRLPSVQGWTYSPLAGGSSPPESTYASNDGDVLALNSVGMGVSLPIYLHPIPEALNGQPFCIETRVRVLAHEPVTIDAAFGIAFGLQTTSQAVGFGLAIDGPGQFRIEWNSQVLSSAIDVTQFHDYRLIADPVAGQFSLYVDDAFVAEGTWTTYPGFDALYLGDGTGTANASAEIASYRLSGIGAASPCSSTPLIELDTSQLPSAQDWTYQPLEPYGQQPESSYASTNGDVLELNSVGLGITGPLYRRQLPESLRDEPFCLETRARVLEHEMVTDFNEAYGLAFGFQTASACAGFGLAVDGPGQFRIQFSHDRMPTTIDVTQFHDYRLIGDPADLTYSFYVDGAFVRSGNWELCSGIDALFLGDSTGTANASAEVAAYRLSGLSEDVARSDFDVSDEGWAVADLRNPTSTHPPVVLTTLTPTWNGSDGNPGGSISSTDPSGEAFFFSAPPKFLGDQSRMFGGSLRYDMRNAANVPAYVANPNQGWLVLVGANETLVAPSSELSPSDTWRTFSFELRGNAFALRSADGTPATDADLRGVLADLRDLYILGDWVNGLGDLAQLDNVVLEPPSGTPVSLDVVHGLPDSGFEAEISSADPIPSASTPASLTWSTLATGSAEFRFEGLVPDIAPGEVRRISTGTTIEARIDAPPDPPASGPPVVLVETGDPAFYNQSIGTLLNGTSSVNGKTHFPTGSDPSYDFSPAEEPNLSAASAVLGDWLEPVPDLSAPGWGTTPISVPSAWPVNTEAAIVYTFDSVALKGLTARIGVDNGVYVWLDGDFKGGAMRPGGVSFGEHVFDVGDVDFGTHYLQVLLEDHGSTNGFVIRIEADEVDTTPPYVIVGSVDLPPLSVAAAHIVGISPARVSLCPDCSATYDVELANPGTDDETYELSVIGLEQFDVDLPASVVVPAGDSPTHVSLHVSAPRDALPGSPEFAVIARTSTGGEDSAGASLEVTDDPPPPIVLQTRGVALQLLPATSSAGQGTAATALVPGSMPPRYDRPRVRVFNLGDASATYDLSATLPAGWTGSLAQSQVTVLPGLSNFVDVALTAIPPVGTPAGAVPLTVTAADVADAAVSGNASGTIDVAGIGVSVVLSPDAGAPEQTFEATVANTGQTDASFDLALGGGAAFAATGLPTSVSLAAGASQTFPVSVGEIDYAIAGDLDLVVRATSQTNPAVFAQDVSTLAIDERLGVTASLDPGATTLDELTNVPLLLNLRNTGTIEDGYRIAVTGVSGPILARLAGLDGAPTLTVDEARLPALASGVLRLDVEPRAEGVGVVTVAVTSLSDPTVSAVATATITVDLPEPPVAVIVAPSSVLFGNPVALDGSGSFDPDGEPGALTYQWSFVSAPAGSALTALDDSTSAQAFFQPDVRGVYEVQLTVSDGELTDSTTAAVSVENNPPIANAGPDANAETRALVTLDGSASMDPDGDLLSYVWTFESVAPVSQLTSANIQNADSPAPSFTPDVDGHYVLKLSVTDGLDAAEDAVEISATTPNVAPNADAGASQNVLVGTLVSLDGSASEDPDDGPSPLTYAWSFESLPAGSALTNADIGGATDVHAVFTPDVAGDFILALEVDDGAATDSTDRATTIVTAANNVPPNADAGDDQSAPLGTVVRLDGSESNDPDLRPLPLTYAWRFVSVEPGSVLTNADLVDADTPTPSFDPDQAGSYVLELIVSDGLDSDSDNVMITVASGAATRGYGFWKTHPRLVWACFAMANHGEIDLGFLRLRDEASDDEIDATKTLGEVSFCSNADAFSVARRGSGDRCRNIQKIETHAGSKPVASSSHQAKTKPPSDSASCSTLRIADADQLADHGWEMTLGLLWANPAKRADGSNRSGAEKLRIQAVHHVIPAICNATLLGTDSSEYLDLGEIPEILASCDGTAIRDLAQRAERFNASGEDIELPFPPGPADPKAIRDDPTDPTDDIGRTEQSCGLGIEIAALVAALVCLRRRVRSR